MDSEIFEIQFLDPLVLGEIVGDFKAFSPKLIVFLYETG